jgi:hypothetical protein
VWASCERFRVALAGTFHPLADSPCPDIHSRGDLPPRSAFLLELPGLETSGFFLPAAPHCGGQALQRIDVEPCSLMREHALPTLLGRRK